MAIKTYVNNGNSWNMVVSSQGNAADPMTSAGATFTSWDPNQINWNQWQIDPSVTLTIGTTAQPTWVGIPYDQWGAPGPLGGNNPFIGGCSPIQQWQDFDFTKSFGVLSKPKGVRPDVLMGFFSQYMHALMFVGDTGTYVVPFMERVGLIWIQNQLNQWSAYDKKEFYTFIDDPDATMFAGTTINKKDALKTMSEAKDE